MKKKNDSPGVYIPPPLFYVLTFFTALFLQKKVPLENSVFHFRSTKVISILVLAGSLFFLVTSLRKFFVSKNTLILIRPASSLQTNGIYNISRNPMYVALALIYLGLSGLIGNWWNIILFPLLFMVIQEYVIKSEEKYLLRAFGTAYSDYKRRVRRWL